jgi:hypothetical protein
MDSTQKDILECILALNRLNIKLVDYSCNSTAQDVGQVAARNELEKTIHAIRTRMLELYERVGKSSSS